MAVLEGGKSASRQTANVNTLVGLNEGDWLSKLYIYNSTTAYYTESDPTTPRYDYACVFQVNLGGNHALRISDSETHMQDYETPCGLIMDPPARPDTAFRYM
ncbi:MAG: hypothetical protein GWO10_30795, partial [candidate division Zixibacteria bacterium]|nr:hypothetical protein [candidate division Zixibacteria bacterium]